MEKKGKALPYLIGGKIDFPSHMARAGWNLMSNLLASGQLCGHQTDSTLLSSILMAASGSSKAILTLSWLMISYSAVLWTMCSFISILWMRKIQGRYVTCRDHTAYARQSRKEDVGLLGHPPTLHPLVCSNLPAPWPRFCGIL